MTLTTRTFLTLVAAAGLLNGCGTTVRYVQTNPPPAPRSVRPASAVHVYTTGGPAQPYTEIGIIQARQDSPHSYDELPEVLDEMRAEAGRQGCDGLVITGRADETQSSVWGQTTVVGTAEGLMGTCIVYVAPEGEEAPVVDVGSE
ncbi:MAG: hypothetical protein AAF928_15660 [Myxococcota bacterium]